MPSARTTDREHANRYRAAARKAFAQLFAALFVLLPLAAAATSGLAQEPAAFVKGLDDVPLMPGLRELPQDGVVFDKPGGRIVEAYAEGEAAAPEVLLFYRETLPQLGWRLLGARVYSREGERLEIDVVKGEALQTVRFHLSPE